MPTTILNHGRVTWTNIVHPTEEDIQQLSRCYPNFHKLNLQDCLTEAEIPKLDHYDDYLFLVVQFPVWEASEQIPQVAEVDIFLARGTLVTSHRGQLKSLERLFLEVQADEERQAGLMAHGASPLLYHLLNELVNECYPQVQQLDHRLRHIEQNLFRDEPRHILHELALARRSVIAMRHILLPQLDVVRSLERGNWPFVHDELDIYWSDIGDHLTQLCSTIAEHVDVVSGLSETVDTLASHRIDEVIRLLTVVTVLTLPMTFLATVFGMNIVMPFSEHPLLFYAVVGIGCLATVFIVWYLNKRRWL